MINKINMTELLADREKGTDGPWKIDAYNCPADRDDVAFAAKSGRAISIGDTLWTSIRGVGPIYPDHDHWSGDKLSIELSDARRITRLPDLEAAFIEVVEALGAISNLPATVEHASGAVELMLIARDRAHATLEKICHD